MGRKKKHRSTPEEQAIHEEAVRLRRMTDKQLVEEFHRAAEQETPVRLTDVAQAASEDADPNENTPGVEKLLSALAEGKCKGVKGATVYKITEFAKEIGVI